MTSTKGVRGEAMKKFRLDKQARLESYNGVSSSVRKGNTECDRHKDTSKGGRVTSFWT